MAAAIKERLACAADLNRPYLHSSRYRCSKPPIGPFQLDRDGALTDWHNSSHIPTVMRVIFGWTEAEANRLLHGPGLTCGWPRPSPALAMHASHLCSVSLILVS